jgi:hypothetical protein
MVAAISIQARTGFLTQVSVRFTIYLLMVSGIQGLHGRIQGEFRGH